MTPNSLIGRNVAVGVGGGIAAYKACDLVRELQRAGASVRVTMTQGATEFVTPLTLQALSHHAVLSDLFDISQEQNYGHLQLSRWADFFIIAPATADLLARIRNGIANDALTASLLAFRGPVLFAPAMNTAMWENERTQDNVTTLRATSRYHWVGPASGALADGDVGVGRLAEIKDIVQAATKLAPIGPLSGKRVLITAGPTREYLDAVRYISNPSTGKMGLALADVARRRGAMTTVVLGPTTEEAPRGVETVRVTSAEEMHAEVMARLSGVDVLVACAAVSDFKPAVRLAEKVKKEAASDSIQLVRTPDILAEASEKLQGKATVVGFAVESENIVANAQKKLNAKKLDFVVANGVSAFEAEKNSVTVISKNGTAVEIQGSKSDVAARIWEIVSP